MKPIIKIHRYWQDTNQTFGTCVVLGDDSQPLFTSLSLERGCQGILAIPADLFQYNTKVTNVMWCFRYINSITSVPPTLLDNNPAITNLSLMFMQCSNISSVVPEWWNVPHLQAANHQYTFREAYNIANYADIPNDWKL